jgi:hypothetical protein
MSYFPVDDQAAFHPKFVAAGNAADLDAERPGSRQDHEMRFAHEYVRRDFCARMRGDVQSRSAAVQRADAERVIAARQEAEIEAAIRSYSRKATAARAGSEQAS